MQTTDAAIVESEVNTGPIPGGLDEGVDGGSSGDLRVVGQFE